MSTSLPSTAAATVLLQPPPPPPLPPPAVSNFFSSLGLGYVIAIALGVLVVLSTLILVSYLCCRRRHAPAAASGSTVVLPRIIFVAEEDEEDSTLESGVVGLDPAVINSYPKFPYARDGGGDATCAICLCEYREGEMMRMLPDCRHVFHLGCIDAWLKLNASCPVCRSSPLPTPLSTPLSEVVPLSQYSDGQRRR